MELLSKLRNDLFTSQLLWQIPTNSYGICSHLQSPALVEVLAKPYSLTPAESVQRYKFHSQYKPGEPVATFALGLCSLAEFYNFGRALEDMLCDLVCDIVCGISDTTIQRWLLAEVKLLCPNALELAQGMETVAQNVKQVQ